MANASDEKIASFPSFLASKEEKSKDSYGREYAKAIWSEYTKNSAIYNTRRERDINNRRYAEGLETITKYKDRLDLNGDTSYLNLDFTPVNRIATIVDNIVGKMMNQSYKIQCNPLDPESRTKFDEYRRELYADMFLKKYSPEIEQRTGIPLVPNNKRVPDSDDEAELHLKLNYKMDASIAMEEALQFVFVNNDFEETRRKILKDLVVLKRAALYRYYDDNKNIRVEYADPVDLITPYSKYEDFRNIPYVAVLKKYTINELAQMNPKFTDQELFDIAKSQQGKNGNPNWKWGDWNSYEGYYATDYVTKPYYDFYIQVLEFYFLTINREVRLKKNNSKGGIFFEKKSDKYTGEVRPEEIAVMDFDTQWKVKGEEALVVSKRVAKTADAAKEYFAKIKNEKKSKNSEVINKEIQYRYEGKWIPGTEYIFNYKMSENIEREKIAGSYSPRTELPFSIIAPDIYDMENKSLVERMIPHEDQINLINLKTQQLLIKAKPPGVAIDLEGMDAIVLGMGDSKNPKMDGIEITKMYEQTGSYTFRSKDKSGNYINGKVIEPLENGIGRDFATLFQAYNNELQKMNDVIGFNSAVDASSPNVDSLVGTQKLAVQATNNALRPTYYASVSLIVRAARRLALMVQDSIEFNNQAFTMAIGTYATKTLEYGRKIAFNQFAINIELLPDDEEKMQIDEQLRIGQQSGMLGPSDVLRIRQVLKEDVKAAGQLLVLLEEKNRKNKMEESAALQEQNGQIQVQSAQAAAQANAQAQVQMDQSKAQLIQLEYQLKSQLSAQEHQQVLEQLQTKNIGTATVAEINNEGKQNVQKAANDGKIVAQQVANVGKELVADKTHHHTMTEVAFENAISPKKEKLEK